MAGVLYPQSTSPAHFHLPGLCINCLMPVLHHELRVGRDAGGESLSRLPGAGLWYKALDRRSSVAAYLPITAASAVVAKADKEISHSGKLCPGKA